MPSMVTTKAVYLSRVELFSYAEITWSRRYGMISYGVFLWSQLLLIYMDRYQWELAQQQGSYQEYTKWYVLQRVGRANIWCTLPKSNLYIERWQIESDRTSAEVPVSESAFTHVWHAFVKGRGREATYSRWETSVPRWRWIASLWRANGGRWFLSIQSKAGPRPDRGDASWLSGNFRVTRISCLVGFVKSSARDLNTKQKQS